MYRVPFLLQARKQLDCGKATAPRHGQSPKKKNKRAASCVLCCHPGNPDLDPDSTSTRLPLPRLGPAPPKETGLDRRDGERGPSWSHFRHSWPETAQASARISRTHTQHRRLFWSSALIPLAANMAQVFDSSTMALLPSASLGVNMNGCEGLA